MCVMWHLGLWLSGEIGSAGVMVGLDDLRGIFQPKLFYDCISRRPRIWVLSPYASEGQYWKVPSCPA